MHKNKNLKLKTVWQNFPSMVLILIFRFSKSRSNFIHSKYMQIH
ncbi:hypothetical protein LEP1GSC133_0555 [Leptospira borgpetersenii serovar Pomona str. 200901868]|uniref:Uncharacterized protein n=2 Tax=Leptospira borgpetersenii TaxID=174 RepID=M3GU45_LEPBO|nr:hypothetical protein LEP1GSC123_1769 [Leptospira borgpetersenii str. 200701203]EMO61662.1 hypothetical protein LEP1GSC133_0555 [Leptospira borgpetersenii serovar Pomona str. 200901868]